MLYIINIYALEFFENIYADGIHIVHTGSATNAVSNGAMCVHTIHEMKVCRF